jgi:hypothetical protein
VATAATQSNTTAQIAMLYQRATFKQLPAQAFVPGGDDVEIPLRKLGYTDMLVVHVHGSYALADTCTPALVQLPHGIVKKFLVDVPGRETPINLSGRTLRIFNLRSNDFGTFPADAVPPNRGGAEANALYATMVDDFPIAESATNDVSLIWIVPFHRSVVDHKGALPTGALDQLNLVLTPNSLADFMTTKNGIGTDVSNVSLTVDVTQVIFSAPPQDANVIAGTTGDGFVVKYDETKDVIEQAGTPTLIKIVPKDTLLAIVHAVTVDGIKDSVDVDRMYLRVEESYFTDPSGIPADIKTVLDAAANGSPFPEGVFVWDADRPATGMAGWIHTDGVNDIEVGLTLKAGTGLGTPNNSNVITGRCRLIELPAGA